MKNLRIPLRVVFYREDGKWVAHCLEFDLMGDGDTRDVAVDRLAEAICLQVRESVENNNPENLFSPADGKFFAMYAAGKDAAVIGRLIIQVESVTIDEAEAREYSDSETDLAIA
jgi:predicted RNase H-like HicB family nuclease